MPRPASLRAQQKQETRRRLLEAAGELFDRQGFGATTVDEIARRVGASRATFYLHFRGKEDIAAALAEQTWAIVAASLERLVDLPDWSRERVLGWIEQEDESWPRIATVTSITRHPGSTWEMDLARRAEEGARQLLRSPHWDGIPDAHLRSRMVLMQLQAFWIQWADLGWSVGREHDLGLLADLLHAAMHPR